MYCQLDYRESLKPDPILPDAPAGRQGGGVESICSSDTGPIDTVAGYGILDLSLKYDKNPTGNIKFEGRV